MIVFYWIEYVDSEIGRKKISRFLGNAGVLV